MRVKKPEPFDPEREYKPGERFVYKNTTLIVKQWTRGMDEVALKFKFLATRCGCCKIDHEDCTGIDLKCWRFNRKDGKQVFFSLFNYKKPKK